MNKLPKCIGLYLSTALLFLLPFSLPAASYNAFGQKHHTIETDHFRLHYSEGLQAVSREIGDILEKLYGIYHDTYHITLPLKTEVIVTDGYGNGGALPLLNTIIIDANAFDFNLRGTTNWLENVVAHEYAHIISIWLSFKGPEWIPYIMYGYFTHPNEKQRMELLHILPNDILPPWFFEGIAQYESTRNNGDAWDTHRDMILRTLILSNKQLSWDHMAVFTGKGDDYEKTYDHGFALTKYIAEKYGYETVIAILRESSKFFRVNFDRGIKEVLGISGRELYTEWTQQLKKKYSAQLKDIGTQIYGKKLNKYGYNNYCPRFGPDNEKIYFLSNEKYEYSRMKLYSYALSDTIEEKKKITMELPAVSGFFDIHNPSGKIVFSSAKSLKSELSPRKGGKRMQDLFMDNLPDNTRKRLFSKKTEKQISEKKNLFHAAFSPSGTRIACTKRVYDRFYLYCTDTAGKQATLLYPSKKNPELIIRTMFSIDWSPDSHHIAISYIDRDDRKIGMFDVVTKEFFTVCDTKHDERDPRFSPDGTFLYFSSDRTGIFNIYRFNFKTKSLQKLTNVSGGAFTPDVSSDEQKLVFANYDENGYGIYLIDTIQVLEDTILDERSAITKRTGYPSKIIATVTTSQVPYSSLPRKFLMAPILLGEQILTHNVNAFKGITNFKIGCLGYLFDPLDIISEDRGNALTAFFLYDPRTWLFDRQEIINKKATYDLGVLASTKQLPLDLDLSYMMRSIAGKDNFRFEGFGDSVTIETLDYNLNPSYLNLTLTHRFNRMANVGVHSEYNLFKVWVQTSLPGDIKYFSYNPTKGWRFGSHLSFSKRALDPRGRISPKGLGLLLEYDFYTQYMQNEVNSFTIENGTIKEVYHAPYRYNQLNGTLLWGQAVPLIKKHDLFFKLDATVAHLTDKSRNRLQKDVDQGFLPSTDIPSFMQPIMWIPGYVYYYKDTLETVLHEKGSSAPPETVSIYMDTVLISGNGVVGGELSYRFPLFPGSIDKKLGFLYLDRLYGAFNFGGAAALNHLSDLKDLHWDDLLLYRGIELRLEAISFNTMPMAISFRWDYGIDRAPPIGGHRLSFKLGFDFDNWDIIVEPRRRVFPQITF